MPITKTLESEILTINCVGDLIGATVNEYLESIMDSLEKNAYQAVLIDLQSVDYVDSAGFGMLIQIHKYIKSKKLKIAVYGMSKTVSLHLNAAGLNQLIKNYDSQSDALNRLNADQTNYQAITWDDSFSVNVAEIDEQHKKWIEITNDLHDSIMKGIAGNLTGKIINSMIEYVEFHFTYEENYMKKNKYNNLTEHRQIHSNFIKKIKKYHQKHQSGKIVFNRAIMEELIDWLQDHILKEDKQYAFISPNEH